MGEAVKLTENQRKLAEDNYKLALKFANSKNPPNGMDMDEWVSECLYNLVKAAAGYDPARSRFSTYAWRSMLNGWCAVYRLKRQIKAGGSMKQTGDSFSLDDIRDHRAPEPTHLEQQETSRALDQVDGLVRALPADLRLYMRQRMQGLSFGDMSKKWGISRQALQQRACHARAAMLAVAEARGIKLG